jgi:MFS family permease
VPNLSYGWRLLFVIGGAIALLGLAVRTVLPESPRWQVLHGQHDQAERTIATMEKIYTARGLTAQPVEDHVAPGPAETRYGRRLAVLITMWFLWYIGNYGFLGDAAQLITDNGAAIGGSIRYLAIGAIGYPVGAVLAILLVERVERRVLILANTVIWLIAMLLIGSFAGEIAIASGAFLAATALGSYLQVAYTFTAESFPTRMRATGFAFSDGIGHAGGAVGALALPIVVHEWSFFAGFAIIGITGLLAGLTALLGPVVTGRRLESVSA